MCKVQEGYQSGYGRLHHAHGQILLHGMCRPQMVRQGNSDLRKEEDERREKVLSEMGLKVVRFRNDEVVRDVSAVVGKVREAISVLSL